ncbi:hypothetical protein Pmani_025211 [Petrolisthes manimaculis]|uniref:Uncharacterized protein n=1 Tax=Petrolisthes manimaculis TaxID=1843537 RepID=A0AAE1P8E2_9EUCA|nr:hypothetical protein Pmani_025211 [Petrolisthes manimaculis]
MKSPPLEGGEGPCEIIQESAIPSGLSLLTGGGGSGGGSDGGSEGGGGGGGGFLGSLEGGGGRTPPPPTVSGTNTTQETLALLQSDLVPHTNFTHAFLKSILTSIDSKDPVVANAWLETLLDVIDLLPKDVIKDEILSLAVSKGQSQQVSARLAACKLIGKIATKFEPLVLKNEIVGVVESLCQDVCGEVRGSMCAQLPPVARGLGLDATKTHILPELVDLCSDEETSVRLAGINTVVLIIPLLDQETRVGTLVPLVRKVCERAVRVEDASLPVTAHLLGRICHGLHDELTEDQKTWFVDFYCTLAKLGLPDSKKTELPMPDLVAEVRSGEYEAECRQQCAYNLPCMVAFAGGSTAYRTALHPTVNSLITDPSHQVRSTVAAAFHQVCTLVGAEVGLLKDGLLQLLRSDNLEVLAALTLNLPHIITTMTRHNAITPQTQRSELVEVVGAVKQGEETVSGTSLWRVHAEALTQAACLAPSLPPDLSFTHIVPLLFLRMKTARPIPCRLAAARTLLVFLRHMTNTDHRDQICATLVSDFCEAESCHKRMLFLNITTMVLEMFSKLFFKTYFFRPLLSLHSDRVANIRLKLVVMLPQMKATLSLPEDKIRLQELETVVGSLLMSEGDRDVSAAISTTISLLDKIEVCESQRGSPEGEVGGQETEEERRDKPQERRLAGDNKSQDKPSPDGGRGESDGGGLGERRSSSRSSGRRSSGVGRLPSYLERRRSNSHAPKQPPDEHTIMRGWSESGDSDDDLSESILLSPDLPASPPLPTSPTPTPSPRLSDRPRERHVGSREDQSAGRRERERGSERDGTGRSAREVFWLRTSRPRWRRKVASADTSPEEPRRHKLGRGWSIEGRGSHSDTDDPEDLYRPGPAPPPGPLPPTASPPSPHGMYTWPPQHTRHRHHHDDDPDTPTPAPAPAPPRHPTDYDTLARPPRYHSREAANSFSSRRRHDRPAASTTLGKLAEYTPATASPPSHYYPREPPLYTGRRGREEGGWGAAGDEEDDLYVYHNLPPTLPPHLYPPTLHTHFTYDLPEDLTLGPTPFSPDPYQAPDPYPYPPYGYDGGGARRGMRETPLPHSFFLLDTAELAPWSSPPAYPIGPLGASWLQAGLHPLARIPSCLIPAPYSRPRPPAAPLASPPWRFPHHTSLPSLSALDPTTDEFLVDAGVRIDESVLRSRLPRPGSCTGPARTHAWRRPDHTYPSQVSPCNQDSRGGVSRLRQPLVVASRIPAPPGPALHRSDSARSQDPQAGPGQRRSSSGGTGDMTGRLRPPSRPGRPVSTVAPSNRGPLTPRTKSLSHENLRTSPSRFALPTSPSSSPTSSRTTSPHTSPQEGEGRPRTLNVAGSRLRQPQVRTPRGRGSRPTSCSSSPGGSRCSSPGMETPGQAFPRSGSRGGSTGSSPASSRCSSPGREDLRSLSRLTSHRPSSRGPRPTRTSSTASTPEQAITPPSPSTSPRQALRPASSIPKPATVTLNNRNKVASKLPLPTSRN